MNNKQSELHAVEASEQAPETVTPEMLDADEAEFAKLRRDLPGVKGASAAGVVSIGVAKIPGKNEFFRTHPEFRPTVPMVDIEVGMEKQYFAVDIDMTVALAHTTASATRYTRPALGCRPGRFRAVAARMPAIREERAAPMWTTRAL